MAENNKYSIIYNGGKLYEVLKYYYTESYSSKLYGFIGRSDEWTSDEGIDVPTGAGLEQKQLRKNLIFAKKINPDDISPIIPRRDWTSGTVYDYYSNDENLYQYDDDGMLLSNFYIRNSRDQVFKCVWNNTGNPSTIEPEITPSVPNIEIPLELDDGYKWMYVTTISKGQKLKFFDKDWMPISISSYISSLEPLSIGFGRIDCINVLDGGSDYLDGYTTVTVNIKGDGDTQATAYAQVEGGKIVKVFITNSGGNYTYATVDFVAEQGSGAKAEVIISPVRGTGYNPCSELGCNHVMLSFDLIDDENEMITDRTKYAQIGLLSSPTDEDDAEPNEQRYAFYTKMIVATGPQKFQVGEKIFQGQSLSTSTFSGTICDIDEDANEIRVINITGKANINAPLVGGTSGSQRILIEQETPSISASSGLLIFSENLEPRTRGENNNEQFRIVVKF